MVTHIISVLVRLIETWPASISCQQASVGELSLVQNDLYPRPIYHVTAHYALSCPSL